VAWFGVWFGVKFNKQGFGAWCGLVLCGAWGAGAVRVQRLVLCGAINKEGGAGKQKAVWGGWCLVWVLQARIRCGFPVKKSISVRIRYKSGGLAMGSSGCGAGAVPSKQAKQTSKGLVLCAVRCGC
jgi:hypothetical protein